VGFEPDPAECERLNREAASQDPPARFLPYALARSQGEVTFYEANWPPASSIYPPNEDFLRAFPFASQLLGVKGERRIELQVLEGGERATRSTLVLDLEVEFAPLRAGQPLFADVDTYLRGHGWKLLGIRRVHWRRNAGLDPRGTGFGGQLTQADALYCNAALLEVGLSEAMTLKLVLILIRRISRRVGSERRRALADAPQPGDATTWQDPHFF
jgi:hypothetical protein